MPGPSGDRVDRPRNVTHMTAVAERPAQKNQWTTRWTDEDHDRALELYRERGLGPAHRETGIPKSTLHRWAMDAGMDPTAASEERRAKTAGARSARAARCEEIRLELREQFLQEAAAALERLSQPYVEFVGATGRQVEYPIPPAVASAALMKTAAIAIDKYRLETGEVTDRTELVGVEVGEAKQHLASVVEMALERRAS